MYMTKRQALEKLTDDRFNVKLLDIDILPDMGYVQSQKWGHLYVPPDDSVQMNEEAMFTLWYWIVERQKMRYKRVNLRLPAPWTSDPVLQEWKFTNPIRDEDRMTIWYINHILKHVDDPLQPGETQAERNKAIMWETLVFRTFILQSTVELIFPEGMTHSMAEWPDNWSAAKERLLHLVESKQNIFHAAYMMPTYSRSVTFPFPKDIPGVKLHRVIYMLEHYWYPKLDEMYEVSQELTLEGLVEWIETNMFYLGRFSAYELVCDLCAAARYTQHKILPYDDDSGLNAGPGNAYTHNLIFCGEKRWKPESADVYLRATWEQWMQRYGLYDEWMQIVPSCVKPMITLRTIEHSMCETGKYLRARSGLGRTKSMFRAEQRDTDVSGLLLYGE